ncbi:lipoxygenase homology domain-containing protein 1-like isoform X2 [Mya arenaria]|uniref:lipoxygenase homology domain-containing protein 1-like isoform X2 n=1 Tax=Mya arenaria TaxID=6604 RepID=UPI0022E41D58|nr:lipoxygenase homology domain-containing protein 1-like isoform X2 [Mya arenaria]
MATVQKKPRKLPKLPGKETEDDQRDQGRGRGRGRGAAGGGADVIPPGKKRELPPLKKGRGRDRDTRSMMDMGRQSPPEVTQRTSLTATNNAKTCFFYIDNDYTFPPLKMVIHPKKHKRLETVSRDLSVRMKNLPFGVRSIYTPRGQHRVHNLEDLTQDGQYVCSSNRKFARGMDVARVVSKQVWHHQRPDSGRKNLNNLLKDFEIRSAKHRAGFRPGYDLSNVYSRLPPKKTTVMKNGEPDVKHTLLLNRRTAQTFEQVLTTLSDLFQFAVMKLFTIDGTVVDGLQKMLQGPEVLVAVGKEPFINLNMDYHQQRRNRSRMSTNMGSRVSIHTRMQNRRSRLSNTKGRWVVTTRTNALPSAGTQAQVTINVYGNKGNSGAVTLGNGDGSQFGPGAVDHFEILVGNVGEIYKIRLAHDNSGDFPGWLCDEVAMRDQDTGEELLFSCRRWLARDEDDQEITRELAVKRQGEPILPLIKYQVDVITGDMWGGGTDANIYITIYGDRGDTGVRQLYAETKGVYFKQGQLDSFEVEAVSLGHLKRIIIGHDGTGPGNGWFLDKVIIREPPFRTNQENVFHCGKWLDEGEDDGKIVRELRAQDEYMDDILEKRHWEFEKWKYDKDCQVVLFSVMTGKALRLNRDLSVDGIGDERDKYAIFDVHPKKPMKPMFSSAATANHYLAIDSGRITGLGKGGPYCEFRVRVQQDRTTLFESVKNSLQFLTIGADGTPGEVRGILDKEPSRRFHVYAKGAFRHKGVIMFCTSMHQAVNVVQQDMTLTGKGKRGGPQAQFRVHKVNTGGIRMFESVAHPGKFVRLKDNKIDCNGGKSEDAHFLVLRHKDKGYITLQSAGQRGLFLGMTPEGRVHTTLDTGVRNIWLYPEVVEWGIKKVQSTKEVEEQALMSVRKPLSPEPEPEPSPEPEPAPAIKQYADGDWSIHVSSLSELVDGDVALVAYGDKGNSGPIVLGAPPGRKIFQEGNEDEFRESLYAKANLLKIGKMFKIRLELIAKISTRNPQWQVKEVRMQDLNTEETLKFGINRWLFREEDDGEVMREMAVQRPGESSLPLRHYVVTVTTGKEMGAETDAPVYITAHGEFGDWGKRYLLHSNNNMKFRTGQVDVFFVEAVSLGALQRCVIGHDGTGAGEGWYLEQVTIKEDEHSPDEFVFPCNRWLDTGMEDRHIERALMVKDKTEAEPEKEPEGDYQLEIITGPESDVDSTGKVHVMLYGENGKSDQIDLHALIPTQKVFEPGNIDKFTVPQGSFGEVYKIRIGRDDSEKWSRWFLNEVRMSEPGSETPLVFSFNRWLARDMDDGDMCRELPAIRVGKPIPQLLKYEVQVVVGDHWAASTDANMYITLHGSHGDSGKRLLHKSVSNRVKFQRGQLDTFVFEVVDLETLEQLSLCHDGRGHGAGVFVEKVVVTERSEEKSHMRHVFPCGRWLDTHEDDCQTERMLRMIDVIDTKKQPSTKEKKKSSGSWTVTVKTSEGERTATTGKVLITVYGTSGHTEALLLSSPDPGTLAFTSGAESEFHISTGQVGRVTKIRLEHDNSGSQPDWRLDYVRMYDEDSSEELMFYADRWLALDKDDGSICRELPAVRKGTPSLPVLRYVVAVTTGSYKDAGVDNANVRLNLIGVDGDIGLRDLTGAISKNRFPWQPGQTDIFIVEAVSVGKIKKIEVTFGSPDQGRWHIQQVSVSEGVRSPTQHMFYCHQWLLPSDTHVTEFLLSEVCPSTNLVEAVESISRGLERPVHTKGRWLVLASTGTQPDAGTQGQVTLVLCGLMGESQPVCINSKEELKPGSIVKAEVKAADIGLIFKVRLSFQDRQLGSSWYFAKMKLKDQDTGEEFIVEHNDLIESTNENTEGVAEIALPRPDIAPLKDQIYIVSVKTGNVPRAETEADVFCNLIGQWGTSGQRLLAVSSNQDKFRGGQVDEFTISCVDLGSVEKVVIGHNKVGRGQGWFCEEVIVKVAELDETIFPCHRWLDTGCGDRKTMTELSPLACIPFSMSLPTRYTQSDGEWNIHVTTASAGHLPKLQGGEKAGEVSVVVYGTDGVRGPLELTHPDTDSPVVLLAPGKTDIYHNIELTGVGEIEKIRVSSGYEGDTEALWIIDKVVLEDVSSGEQLVFDFSQWVGQVGGDIRKEVPLVTRDKPTHRVIPYFVEVHTSEEEMNASTNANVFITLYGSHADSGRRHLIHSKSKQKRFQSGQNDMSEVDQFEIEAVDLGDLEKIVVAKGPGKPWLLEKIVVKKGEFEAEEQIFMFGGWIGDKESQGSEVEETLKLTATIPSHVAIPIKDAPHLEPTAGRWSIEVVTGGRRGPDGALDPVVVFCGQDGETPHLHLTPTSTDTFQIGLTDTFKVKYTEKVGELRKVRFGFADQSVNKAWYIRKVKFEDEDSGDVFWAEVNDWVAIDNKLDGCREVAVPWPAVIVQQVMEYKLSVHLGQVNPDSWENEVYVCLIGDQGSTGRRLLKHSETNTEKFRDRQVDVFLLEAVNIGDLVKLLIGHNNMEKGGGWFLERVVVHESVEDTEQVLFMCNKWLDAGEDDGQVERTLFPSDEPVTNGNQNNNTTPLPEVTVPLVSAKIEREPTSQQPPSPQREPTPEREPTPAREETPTPLEPTQEVREPSPAKVESPVPSPEAPAVEEEQPTSQPHGIKYNITMTTGGEVGLDDGQLITMVMYGDRGHSSPKVMGNDQEHNFKPGSTDTFDVYVEEDIGDMYKVRLGFHEEETHPNWYTDIKNSPTWFLEKLTVRNEVDMEVYNFDAGISLKVTQHQDFWRELPVKNTKELDVYQYEVSVYTSEQSKPNIEANMYLQIFGECGDTGFRKFMASKTHTNKFEPGNRDVFEVGAVDLGKLTQLKLRHDGSGPGSGWQLDKVVVRETEETTIRYVFKYDRYVDEGGVDMGVEQTLALSQILVSDEEKDDKPAEQQAEQQVEQPAGYHWIVETVTEDYSTAETSQPVEMVVYQSDGQHQTFVIGDADDFKFKPGATDTFDIRLIEELGDLYKVRIGYHGVAMDTDWYKSPEQAPTWCLKQLKLQDKEHSRVYEVTQTTWLQMDEQTDFWREQPFPLPNGAMPSTYQYHVELHTSTQSRAGTGARVFLSIHGNHGDTGFRRLMTAPSTGRTFEPGNCDIFEMSAVDLGDLSMVSLMHDGGVERSGWFLDKVIVRETGESTTKYVFSCDKWQDIEEGEKVVTMEIPLTEVVEDKEEKSLSGAPWSIWVVTGGDVAEELEFPVELVLYGDSGHSQPVIIGGSEGATFNKGQVDAFEVRVEGEVGALYKVRVGFHGDGHSTPWYSNYHLAPSWLIENLKLKDETAGVEYEVEGSVSVQTEKHTDFWRELPVINTGKHFSVYKYEVCVHTQDGSAASEDSIVSVQLYGERGDSGPRRLMASKTHEHRFQTSQADMFEIPAVDLGKLTKVKVNQVGSRSGWLIEKVTVKESTESLSLFVFACGHGLEGVGGQGSEVILPLTEVVEIQPEQEKEVVEPKTYQVVDWLVRVVTSEEMDSGTDSNVTLTVYGDADNTGPISLGSPSTGSFNTGKTDEFDVILDPEAIGQIRKIRLEHDNSGKPWQVEKVVLVRRIDDTHLVFTINKWLTLERPGFDIAVEVAVSGSDWPVREYVVQTQTGDGFGSGTEASVYVNIVGTLGDTGKRFLVHHLEEEEEKKFQSGAMDTFLVRAVDIGRLVQVVIGHDGKGPGSGWFLKNVNVREALDAQDKYIFTCEKWLHDEKDDCQTERILTLDYINKGSKSEKGSPEPAGLVEVMDESPDGRNRTINGENDTGKTDDGGDLESGDGVDNRISDVAKDSVPNIESEEDEKTDDIENSHDKERKVSARSPGMSTEQQKDDNDVNEEKKERSDLQQQKVDDKEDLSKEEEETMKDGGEKDLNDETINGEQSVNKPEGEYNTEPVNELKEEAGDIGARAKTVSREGLESRTVSREGAKSSTVSREGPKSRTVSREGPKSRTVSREGPKSRTVSREGPKSRAVSREGLKSRTNSREGQNSNAVSREGPRSRAVSREGSETYRVAK